MNNKRCEQCNSTIFEDGTVSACGGVCDRELSADVEYLPLDFGDDGVPREFPDVPPFEFESEESGYGGYEDEE